MKNFDFSRVIKVVLKHFWIVIVTMVIGAGLTVLFRPQPKLTQTATAQFVVNPNKQFDVSNGTLLDLVKTKSVLGHAVNKYNKSVEKKADKVSFESLAAQDSGLTVTLNGNSRIVTITTSAETTGDVKSLVNGIAKQAVVVAKKTMPVYEASVVTPAYLTSKSSGGLSGKKALVIGAAVGLIVGVELAIIYDRAKLSFSKKR